jgi:hypothetical protein
MSAEAREQMRLYAGREVVAHALETLLDQIEPRGARLDWPHRIAESLTATNRLSPLSPRCPLG